jgi:hypothetical protein
MPADWTRLRTTALDAVATLGELLADPAAEDRRLIVAYLDTKQALADAFEALAVERYFDPAVLGDVKLAIEATMHAAYSGLPEKYLRVRGFGTSHARLLAYLCRSPGAHVSAAELRILTGDAVHTERRARDLRDLGFDVVWRHTGGSDVYILTSSQPDLHAAARSLVAKNIQKDRSLREAERIELLAAAGLA